MEAQINAWPGLENKFHFAFRTSHYRLECSQFPESLLVTIDADGPSDTTLCLPEDFQKFAIDGLRVAPDAYITFRVPPEDYPFTFRFDRAVFTDSKLAAEAAVRIIKHVREINPRICVKIGLHAGPCLAVNSNDKLDYFGTTVNRAARIQGQSLGNDIVMSIDFEHSHGLRIPDQFTRMPFQSTLKGLKGTADLVRWSYVQGNKRI